MNTIIKSTIILALASVLFFGSAGAIFADDPTSFGSSVGVTYENDSAPEVDLDRIWETN